MKRTLLTSFITTLTILVYSQPELDWAFGIGGTSFETPANSVATDADGNVYMAGCFYGEVDFDPFVATVELTATEGYEDSFFAKYDANGNLVYVKHIKGGNYVRVSDLALDEEGNIYLTGRFGGSIDFNPSNFLDAYIEAEGYGNSFIAKYTNDGHYLFAKQIGGDTGAIDATSLAVDAELNIYVAGGFRGSPDFETQPGEEATITSDSNTGADMNAFVAKYDSDCNYQAAKNIARGEGDARVNAIIIDQAGDIVVTGEFKGTATFHQIVSTSASLDSEGMYDAFVAKYGGDLGALFSYMYAKRIGGLGNDRGNDLAIDAANNVYVTGTFNTELIDEDGASLAMSAGGSDFFFFSYDAVGNSILERTFGGSGPDEGRAIIVDDAGMIYVAGTFSGAVDFNPLPFLTQVDMYTSAGGTDIFLAKYNSIGFYLGGHYGGSLNDEKLYGIAADANGNVFLSGIHRGTAEFGTDESVLVSHESYDDIFLAKYAFDFVTNDIEENTLSQAALYPNPTSGNITLSLSGQHGYHGVDLLDISGRTIQSSFIAQGAFIKELHTDYLAAGVYFIRLIGNNRNHTLKFVRQ